METTLDRGTAAVMLGRFPQAFLGDRGWSAVLAAAFPVAEMLASDLRNIADWDDFDAIAAATITWNFYDGSRHFIVLIPCALVADPAQPSRSAAVRELLRELDQRTLTRPA